MFKEMVSPEKMILPRLEEAVQNAEEVLNNERAANVRSLGLHELASVREDGSHDDAAARLADEIRARASLVDLQNCLKEGVAELDTLRAMIKNPNASEQYKQLAQRAETTLAALELATANASKYYTMPLTD